MKKVLVTGAAGVVGLNVLKYLLSEGKYEITALDSRLYYSFSKCYATFRGHKKRFRGNGRI